MLKCSYGGEGTVEAALIARGPYLAPGRIVPKSKGSPIMATSGLTLLLRDFLSKATSETLEYPQKLAHRYLCKNYHKIPYPYLVHSCKVYFLNISEPKLNFTR